MLSLSQEPAAPNAFDHGAFDSILRKYVNDAGRVDYPALLRGRGALDLYILGLGAVPESDLRAWPREEQMAFFINAYNAITLRRIIDHYPPKGSGLLHPKISIRNIDGVWTKLTTRVAGQEMTLDAIEHDILRKVYRDPRAHAAIVCASVSCPSLAREAYTGARLNEQLDREARRFARDLSKNKVDPVKGVVGLSPIFEWFKEDFADFANEVPAAARAGGRKDELAGGLGFLIRYGDPELKEFLRSGDYKLKLGEYDWRLNAQ